MTSLDESHFPWLAHNSNPRSGQATHDLKPKRSGKRVPALPIPDLRFEQSFLLSLKPFIKPKNAEEFRQVKTHGKTAEIEHIAMAQPVATQDVFAAHALNLDWGSIAWVTLRDQLISPLLQGVCACCIQQVFQEADVDLSKAQHGADSLSLLDCCGPPSERLKKLLVREDLPSSRNGSVSSQAVTRNRWHKQSYIGLV